MFSFSRSCTHYFFLLRDNSVQMGVDANTNEKDVDGKGGSSSTTAPVATPSTKENTSLPNDQYSGIATILQSGETDEGASWINGMIRELWPFAANISQFVLLEYVQPALIAAVPSGLPVPRFSKIDVGTSAPTISNICVLHRKFGKNDSAAVIEAEFSLESNDMDIQMTLSNVTFGVNRVKLNGRVEIVLRPLLNRVPLIGAGQIAFINNPTLEYNLTGLAAFGNQRIISGIVRQVADTVLGSVVVLPNRIAYKSTPDVDYFKFSTKPVGILRIAAIGGEGFPSTDRDVFKQAVGMSELPDVYLVLKHGNVTFQTERVDDSANPIYTNQIFDFVLTSESTSQLVNVKAYDYDLGINNDDFLGETDILVSELIEKGVGEFHLKDSPEDAKPTVKLVAKWITLSSSLRHVQHAIMTQRSDTLKPASCSALLLTIEVDEAHNLPSGKRPFVQVRVGQQICQTSAAYDLQGMFSVENPEFEQSFHISLQGVVDASVKIEFQVIDQTTSEILGVAFCSLSEAVEACPSGKIFNFALMKAKKANASLRVRTKLAAVIDQPPLWEVLATSDENKS